MTELLAQKINKIFNINSREWPRIFVAWGMTFLVRFGFIIGWTILIATFLSRTGIEHLPELFLTNALLVMLGAIFFRNFIRKIKLELLISLTVLSASVFILFSMFFIYTSSFLFFGFILFSEAVLLAQLNILLSLFNEELFSPLESQRTFPIIDSAETIGGIFGGLALTFLSNSIPAYKFLLIWVLSLLLILPIVLKFNSKTMDTPTIQDTEEEDENKHATIVQSIHKMKKVPFLKGLMVVILLQWAIMNVVEFQYTKAIQQNVFSTQEETLLSEENSGEIMLASEVTEETKHYEHEFTKKLGILQVIFNGGALFIQLILASRIIVGLGISSSLLLHPIATLFNVLGLTLRFGFFTAAMTRGSFELTFNIFKNAYHSSYYATPQKMRSDIKEVLEGFMKPFGAIIGTLFIILLFSQTRGIDQTLSINIGLVTMTVIMIICTSKLSKSYTKMSEQNLTSKLDLPTRINAVEILSQNGHENQTPSLIKILKRKNEPDVIKEAIIKTLGSRQNLESIGAILEMLQDKNDNLRLSAIRALANFEDLKKQIMNQSFTRYEVIETLKTTIHKEENEYIREKLVKTFYKFSPDEVVAYLISEIKNDCPKKANFIRMFKLFPDPNIKHFIGKFLKDKNVDLKCAAIIALWQFKNHRTELEHHLTQQMESNKPEILMKAIETAGIIQYKVARNKIRKLSYSHDQKIKNAAIMALAQMEDEKVIPRMIQTFLDDQHEWYEKTHYIIESLPKKIGEKIKNTLQLHISDKISEILLHTSPTLEELSPDTISYLIKLYERIGAHHEIQKIQKILASSSSQKI